MCCASDMLASLAKGRASARFVVTYMRAKQRCREKKFSDDQIHLHFYSAFFPPQSPRPISSPPSLTDATSSSYAPTILFLRTLAYVMLFAAGFNVDTDTQDGQDGPEPSPEMLWLTRPGYKDGKDGSELCVVLRATPLYLLPPSKEKSAKDFNLTSPHSSLTCTHTRAFSFVLSFSGCLSVPFRYDVLQSLDGDVLQQLSEHGTAGNVSDGLGFPAHLLLPGSRQSSRPGSPRGGVGGASAGMSMLNTSNGSLKGFAGPSGFFALLLSLSLSPSPLLSSPLLSPPLYLRSPLSDSTHSITRSRILPPWLCIACETALSTHNILLQVYCMCASASASA